MRDDRGGRVPEPVDLAASVRVSDRCSKRRRGRSTHLQGGVRPLGGSGEAAAAAKDQELIQLVYRFMNSYLRTTLNARDVRTAYNVLNQYRLMVETMLRQGNSRAALAGGATWLAVAAAADLARRASRPGCRRRGRLAHDVLSRQSGGHHSRRQRRGPARRAALRPRADGLRDVASRALPRARLSSGPT